MNIIDFFNQPFPGDPQAFRLIIVGFVAATAFGWTRDVVRRWNTDWSNDYPIRRNAMWLTALLITNGILLLTAAQRDDPIRVGTALLGFVFVGLSSSLLIFSRVNRPLLRFKR